MNVPPIDELKPKDRAELLVQKLGERYQNLFEIKPKELRLELVCHVGGKDIFPFQVAAFSFDTVILTRQDENGRPEVTIAAVDQISFALRHSESKGETQTPVRFGPFVVR